MLWLQACKVSNTIYCSDCLEISFNTCLCFCYESYDPYSLMVVLCFGTPTFSQKGFWCQRQNVLALSHLATFVCSSQDLICHLYQSSFCPDRAAQLDIIKGTDTSLWSTEGLHDIITPITVCFEFDDASHQAFTKYLQIILRSPMCRYKTIEEQREDWKAGHKFECKALQAFAPNHPGPKIMMAARVLWRRCLPTSDFDLQ